MTAKKYLPLPLLIGQVYTNIQRVSFQTNNFFSKLTITLRNHDKTSIFSMRYSPKELLYIMLKKKRKRYGDRHVRKNDTWYKKNPVAVRYTLSRCSPLCFVTWGLQPLRQAHWLSASTPLLVDTPLSCQINNQNLYQYQLLSYCSYKIRQHSSILFCICRLEQIHSG